MVKNLFLIRHAFALPAGQNQRDFNRRLSETGRKQSVILGGYLKNLGTPIQAIYTSPSLRTLETAAQLLPQLDEKPRIIEAEEYYNATRNLMMASLNRLDDLFDTVCVIAHNPAVSEAFSYLTGDYGRGFGEATCAWLQLPIEEWSMISSGLAEVKDYYYPGRSI